MKKVILAGAILLLMFALGFCSAAYYYYCCKVKLSADSTDSKRDENINIANEKNEELEYKFERNKSYAKDKENEHEHEHVTTVPKVDFEPIIADTPSLDVEEREWYYVPKKDGTPSGEPQEVKELIKRYHGYYLGNTEGKTIYLTFDEGYENGYTGKILDTLKENNVKAAFFVTTPYINDNKELVKRMVVEGHMVCNHSTTHPSMAAFKDEESFNKELLQCEKSFEQVTGEKMSKYFRPPMGKYSELSLYYTQKLKYKTIFWSFAYEDWEPTSQPTEEYAKSLIMERTHSGGIYLLHAVSKTNTDILDWLIKKWKEKGFQFKALNEIE